MPNKTTIEWTDLSSNPIRARRKSDGKAGWYCQKVSQGCAHCYAERRNNWIGTHVPFSIARQDEVEIYLDSRELERIAKIPAGKKVFICDMTDLFGEFVRDDFIWQVFKAMAANPWATFLLLTKRAKRMAELVPMFRGALPDRLDHVWLGASVCTQADAEEQLPHLLRIRQRAPVLFASCEPLLEPLDLSPYLMCQEYPGPLVQPSKGTIGGTPHHTLRIQGRLDWVIAGCESGPGARPSHPDWFRSLRDQCIDAGTSFFLKQMVLNGKMIKMPELDGENWKEFPDAQRLS